MNNLAPLMKPYVSADIETTGLNPKTSLIIEIGAAIDPDGIKPLDHLTRFRCLIKHDKIIGDEYAINMNKLLIEEAQDTGVAMRHAIDAFINYLSLVPGASKDDCRVTFCGKNLAMFDFEFLRLVMDIAKYSKHRLMDPGSLYYPYFGKIPSLGDINELVFGNAKVAHTAVEDSLNCISLFRWENEFKKALLNHQLFGTPMPLKFSLFLEKIKEIKKAA